MATTPKRWTIMVYMAGDNNLADEMIATLQQVQESELDKSFTLKVLFDPGGARKVVTRVGKLEPGRATRGRTVGDANTRLRLDNAPSFKRVIPKKPEIGNNKSKRASIGQHAHHPEPELVTVEAERVRDILQAFVRDTIIHHPADHYLLILSGHGSGAVGDFLAGNRRSSSLNIQDIRQVLDGVRRDFSEGPFKGQGQQYSGIDILGFDSCLMSMTEIAYEVRTVKYLVGAEGFEPDNGWPYARILEALTTSALASRNFPRQNDRSLDPLEPQNVAKKIVQVYHQNYMDYTDADISTDLAALSLDRIDDLRDKLKVLTDVLGVQIDHDDVKDAIVLAHWEAQGYKDEQYTDLWDFCNRLAIRCSNVARHRASRIRDACEAVQKVIANGAGKPRLVLRSCYTGAAFQHSHGVSVFFPWSRIADAGGRADLEHYKKLRFVRETGWGAFLQKYVNKTQRLVRKGPEGEVDPNDPANKNLPFEESRLNHRRGLFSGKPGEKTRIAVTEGRYDPDYDNMYDPDYDNMYDPDYDNMFGKRPKTTSMKNPPVCWLPCENQD